VWVYPHTFIPWERADSEQKNNNVIYIVPEISMLISNYTSYFTVTIPRTRICMSNVDSLSTRCELCEFYKSIWNRCVQVKILALIYGCILRMLLKVGSKFEWGTSLPIGPTTRPVGWCTPREVACADRDNIWPILFNCNQLSVRNYCCPLTNQALRKASCRRGISGAQSC
jgi:hypothetical protein